VPVLDLARVASEDHLAAELRDACTSSGFFYLVGHGVEQLQAQALDAAKQLLTLPESEKRRLQATQATKNRGWTPLGDETLDPAQQQRGDTKEGWYFGREATSGSPSGPLQGPNLWPSPALAPGVRETLEAYMAACVALSRKLLRLFALALQLDAEHFAEHFDRPQFFLRPLRYSAEVSVPEEGLLGCGAHSDYGMLTLLATGASGSACHSPSLTLLVSQWHSRLNARTADSAAQPAGWRGTAVERCGTDARRLHCEHWGHVSALD